MSNTPNRRKKFMLVVFIIFAIIVCILSEKYKAPENIHRFSNIIAETQYRLFHTYSFKKVSIRAVNTIQWCIYMTKKYIIKRI